MAIINGKSFTQYTNLNILDELRIQGVLVHPAGGQDIIEVSTTYTVELDDDIVIATGTFTVTLPLLSTAIKSVTIKSALGGGTITVDGDGSETIEGTATQTLTVGTSITIAPATNEWVII